MAVFFQLCKLLYESAKKLQVDIRVHVEASTGGWVLSHFFPAQVKTVRDTNGLKEKSKGKTKEGASEPLTMGDLQSHRKMFNLIKNTFPEITVGPSAKIICWVFLPDLCPVPSSV